MQLTPVQFDRLPALLQTIVQTDRQLAGMRKPVITIGEARDLRQRYRERRDLTRQAHNVFGNELKGRDGSAKK